MREFKREKFLITRFDYKDRKIYYQRVETNKELKCYFIDCFIDMPKWLGEDHEYKYLKITYYCDGYYVEIDYQLLEDICFC